MQHIWLKDDGSLRHFLYVDKGKVRQNKAILCRESVTIESVLFIRGQEGPDKTES